MYLDTQAWGSTPYIPRLFIQGSTPYIPRLFLVFLLKVALPTFLVFWGPVVGLHLDPRLGGPSWPEVALPTFLVFLYRVALPTFLAFLAVQGTRPAGLLLW